MTAEAQRIAIAEACGAVCIDQDGLHKLWFRFHGRELPDIALPDYLNDLNAMAIAEESVIEPHHIEEYAAQLYVVLERFWTCDRWVKFSRLGIDYAFAHATTAQRAEAVLRTLGKWIETPTP